MKHVFASTLLALAAATSTLATAQTSGGGDASKQQCSIGYVTGVGGPAQSFREYIATPGRDQYRYIADNPIRCKVSDDDHASDCTGVESFRHEKVSVYDDIDATTMAVVARVELDHGMTYPLIIQVRKQDVQCDE